MFASLTVNVIAAASESMPSLTTTLKVYSPGPCASVGVQVNAPVPESMAAPAGPPVSENVRGWTGSSGSVAVAVKE